MFRVRYREFALLAVIAATALTLGRIVVVDVRQSADDAKQLYERLARGLELIDDVQYGMEEVRRIILYALHTSDANRQLQYAEQSRSIDAGVQALLDNHPPLLLGPITHDRLGTVARAWQRYLVVRDDVIALILEGGLAEGVSVDEHEGTDRYNDVRLALVDLKLSFESDALAQVAEAKTRANRATARLILLVSSALIAAAVGIYLVNRRRQVEQALRVSESHYRAIFDHANVGIAEVDDCARFVAANDRACEILGYSRAELLGMTARELTLPDDRQRTDDFNAQLIDGRVDRSEYEKRCRRRDGALVWVLITASAIRDANGRFLRAIATILDISERKAADEKIRGSLEEKDVLLREVHHRVKNNLAVISSLFYLQSNYSTDAAVARLLQESQDRVRSMALVHESLYRSTNLTAVEFRDYARGLAEHLIATYHATSGPVRLKLEMQPIALTLEQAIPCGLLLNELVTNALKHAFVEARAPELTITGRCTPDGRCEIGVHDNGVGVPEDLAGDRTFGLRLIRLLGTQLDAEVSIRRVDPGTDARVSFVVAPRRATVEELKQA
jgi:PAS domain S-box-containing protein